MGVGVQRVRRGGPLGLMLVLILAAGCTPEKPEPVVAMPEASPVETAEEFAARREAEVQRAVAEAREQRRLEEQRESSARRAAMDADQSQRVDELHGRVREALKDPDSAQFGRTVVVGVGVLCGYVNARNSFGGYTGEKRFVVTSDLVMLEEKDTRHLMDMLWATYGCEGALARL